ncbi:MAG TPA: DUF924 family protein [Beijerinckiaceae bacterium]|nr:DUF924 family protein [Beijerinckiaceae bacterium]
MTPQDVTGFWLQAGPKRWFARDAAFDAEIRRRFGAAVEDAREGRLDSWADSDDGALALVILLDQFSRNIHRGSPLAFAGDDKARAVAEAVIARGGLDGLPTEKAQWFILPFEHHEDMGSQERAIRLFEALGDAELVKWAVVHRDIIAMFGRFPHRNAALGRETTAEEAAFLAEGGFAG